MNLKWTIKDYWWKIRDWFNPRQKWLIKQIPNSWVDKDHLWEICILEGIKHYVEQDGGLDGFEKSQIDPEYPEHQKKFDREVAENYDLITQRLPQLERRLKVEWEAVPKWDFKDLNSRKIDYEKTYGKIDELENMIDALKTKVMIWAILNRGSIWT